MSEANSTKYCPKCTSTKPLAEFYNCVANSDGRQASCKICRREYVNSDAGRLATAKDNAKYYKTIAGRLSKSKSDARWVALNPAKVKARNSLNYAIRTGIITRDAACEQCSDIGVMHGHHDDYTLPLDVRWLCPICHKAWHKENGSGLNG